MKTQNLSCRGFTLVELIVVITILAVLATIGFISFQGYGVSSRDSVRLADMTSISKGFNIKLTKGEHLPLPENKIDITASGTIINYQGDAGESVLGDIGVHGGGIDPLDQSFYTYSTNAVRNKYQILGTFESSINDNQYTPVQNISEKYLTSKGDQLGILLNENSLLPIEPSYGSIDILNTNESFSALLNSYDKNLVSGTGFTLSSLRPDASCKRIQELNNGNGDGYYNINPSGTNEIEVYCNMSIDGGGWTLINDWERYTGDNAINKSDTQHFFANELMQIYSRTGSVVLDINNDGDYLDSIDIINFEEQKFGYIIKDFSSKRDGCLIINSIVDVIDHITSKKDLGICNWGNSPGDFSTITIDHLGKDDSNISNDLVLNGFSKDECLYTDNFEWDNIHGISWNEKQVEFLFQYSSSNVGNIGKMDGEGSMYFCNGISWHISHIDHHYNYHNPLYTDRALRLGSGPYTYPYIQHLNTNKTFIR